MNRTDRVIGWFKNNKFFSIIIISAIVIGGISGTLASITNLYNFLNKPKPKITKKSIYPILDSVLVRRVATDILKEEPAFCRYKNIDGENYIITFTKSNERFTLYKQFAHAWETIQVIDSLNSFNQYTDPEDWVFTEIDSLPTLFFATGSFGNTFGSVDFYLIPFKKDYSYDLYHIEIDGRLDANGFDNSDYNVTRNKFARLQNNFSKYLEDKFAESNLVTSADEGNSDLNNPVNALKAWEISNAEWLKKPVIDTDTAFRLSENYKIKFQYFSQDLIQVLSEESAEPDSENDNFAVYNIFKYASVIKDKKQGHYFIALGYRSWSMGLVELRGDSLYAAGSLYFEHPFMIDLRTGKISVLVNETNF